MWSSELIYTLPRRAVDHFLELLDELGHAESSVEVAGLGPVFGGFGVLPADVVDEAEVAIVGGHAFLSTEFGLDEWSADDRALLTESLIDAEIPHRWEDTTVVVAADWLKYETNELASKHIICIKRKRVLWSELWLS